MNFEFLKSVRFWKLFVVALVEFLGSQGILDSNFAHAVSLWLGGSVVLRTWDKFGENLGKS